MKNFYAVALLLGGLTLAPAALAQRWEVGGGVGGSFFKSDGVKNAVSSGDVGLANGVAASFWLGNNSSHLIGGELRYDYEHTELKLSSGGTNTSFDADTHVFHYDFLLHFTSKESRVRPYISAGGGIKLFRGTGKESAFQPLSSLALLTKATDSKGMVSAGAGFKFSLSRGLQIRAEIRDTLTPFPNKVIAPAQGAKIDGWLLDFVAMAGVSITL